MKILPRERMERSAQLSISFSDSRPKLRFPLLSCVSHNAGRTHPSVFVEKFLILRLCMISPAVLSLRVGGFAPSGTVTVTGIYIEKFRSRNIARIPGEGRGGVYIGGGFKKKPPIEWPGREVNARKTCYLFRNCNFVEGRRAHAYAMLCYASCGGDEIILGRRSLVQITMRQGLAYAVPRLRGLC